MCTDTSPSGFLTFQQQEWRTYCAQFDRHLNDPFAYELDELTDFFAAYPTRASELSSKLARYDKPQRCFESTNGKIIYRDLRDCLDHDVARDLEIQQAWKARADAWLEEYERRTGQLRRDLQDVELEAQRIEQKVGQQLDLHAPMALGDVDRFATVLDVLQKERAAIDEAARQYSDLIKTSKTNAELHAYIDETYAKKVEELLRVHEKNREALAALEDRERFILYGAHTAGKPCTEGPKARKEQRVARKLLDEFMEDIKAGETIHITAPITSSTPEDGSYEERSIEGFICGARGPEHQFKGRPTMCAQYEFKLTQKRRAGARRWEDWELNEVTESGLKAGVDCALLKR